VLFHAHLIAFVTTVTLPAQIFASIYPQLRLCGSELINKTFARTHVCTRGLHLLIEFGRSHL
jgi:hypothetical protein